METYHIPVVFFDIGATLIAGPAITPAQQIATALGLNDIAHQQLNRLLLTSRVETPVVLARMLAKTYSIPKRTATKLAIAVWRSQTEVPEAIIGGVELLSTLRTVGVQYGFISNIWFPYAATFYQLYGHLAESRFTFFSFYLGLTKPNLNIFRYAIAATGSLPQTCVMVGDSYNNDMYPATTLGMKTVWVLHRLEQELSKLKRVERKELPTPNHIVFSLTELDIITLTSV